MLSVSKFLLALTFVAGVSAHGYIGSVTIDGKNFTGNVPNADKDPSAIRQIDSVEPVKGASNADLACGQGATKASLDADANPGDAIDVDWRGGDGTNWPHNIGPMLTYMADCSGDCKDFDTKNAKWFKIQQVGRKSTGGDWAQEDVQQGKPANFTLPNNLKAGNYIMRHEIIALHNAQSQGGAEFYPSCTQLKVGGSGTGAPQDSELVSFPGAYKDNDPGILVDVFDNTKATYKFPGPNVASFISGDTTSNTTSSSNGKASSSTKSGSCSLKKSNGSSMTKRNTVKRPKHISRVMRNLSH